ncbi:DUF1212-domain-containing protein [Aspergillus steynii IBT 23096]|uniref:DUF1212-domain-containing protein n=1 Tax=Aspergillus steynii IBT 23096 TaxID=1392250 RepID=A0A2I2GKZ6_9EURO|nr:DUF1212-domain-containing protein [Aspergillus steynii IBT 23096]PLB53562.1 DUF1212-domain-containing protein [Aspergillus steynii IBT 23096]
MAEEIPLETRHRREDSTATYHRRTWSERDVANEADGLILNTPSPPPDLTSQDGFAQRVRRAASRVGARLGRDPDGGDALNASLHPEGYGAIDDIQLAELMEADLHDDTFRLKLRNALDSEAHTLAQGLGLRNLHPVGQTVGNGEEVNGGVLSHLVQSYTGHRRQFSESTLSVASVASVESTASQDSQTGKTKKPRKQKWYDEGEDESRVNGKAKGKGKEKAKLRGKGKKRQVQLTEKIGAILARQQYMMRLCRALMKYGAPTHRLEEYMQMTANVLTVQGQFMYLPGCMIMSFDDPLTHTAEVKVVSVVPGLDLGRLAMTHNVYKNVMHGKLDVDQAISDLDELMKRKNRYHKPWVMVILSGLASVAVGPWGFDARPIDMPVIFLLGCLLGILQHVLAPASAMYSNVFEVSVAILVSFLARAFGSIRVDGQPVFCFPAMAQASIALILPGYSVLCSSLELQSHQIVAGSIRLVYTIIYCLFLGYGVTVGITIYGLMDSHATTEASCPAESLLVYGNDYIHRFVFVAIYCAIAGVINQAKWKQIPMMVFLGLSGYVTNYFANKALDGRLASTIGAFTIGLLANLYSRVWHGHAAAVIVPGMFTLVSSGLATSGSIMSGLAYAAAVKNNTAADDDSSSGSLQDSLSGLGYSMVQTALGITVGLFLSALVVYPYGKRRSGLFNL